MATEIDTETLNELRALKNDDGSFFAKLMKLFLDAVEEGILGIESAFKADDFKAARAAAHALKGCSFNVGARSLVSLCEELEEQAATGTLKRAGDIKKQLLAHARLAALEVQGLPELNRK